MTRNLPTIVLDPVEAVVADELICALAGIPRDAVLRALDVVGYMLKLRQRKRRVTPPDGLKTAAQAAAKLNCSLRTLDGYVASGTLKYVAGGLGKQRTRKLFTDVDIAEFIATQTRQENPCPFDATRGRRSGSSISRSTVVAFSGLQRRPSGAKPKP
jgi:hypothetical protein